MPKINLKSRAFPGEPLSTEIKRVFRCDEYYNSVNEYMHTALRVIYDFIDEGIEAPLDPIISYGIQNTRDIDLLWADLEKLHFLGYIQINDTNNSITLGSKRIYDIIESDYWRRNAPRILTFDEVTLSFPRLISTEEVVDKFIGYLHRSNQPLYSHGIDYMHYADNLKINSELKELPHNLHVGGNLRIKNKDLVISSGVKVDGWVQLIGRRIFKYNKKIHDPDVFFNLV